MKEEKQDRVKRHAPLRAPPSPTGAKMQGPQPAQRKAKPKERDGLSEVRGENSSLPASPTASA